MAYKRSGDPDRGPKMIEGAQPFDKGYESNHEEAFPDYDHHSVQRGNDYFNLRNPSLKKDAAKIKSNKAKRYM